MTQRSTHAHATRVVAVDLGYAAVRAVEVETRGEHARILKRGAAVLDPGVWADLAASRDALTQAIRSALSAGGISATQAIASLPRRLVWIKYTKLPPAAPEHMRGLVEHDAGEYIPYPLSEVVLDHQVISEEGDDLSTVMLVSARRALVDDVLAAFDKAGVEIVRLSVSALGPAEHVPSTATPVAVVDVERGEMDLAVVHAGRLLFTRAASLPDAVDSAAVAHTLAAEVVRSLTAYQNEYRSHSVDRLLVAGAAADLPEIETTLGQMLELPIERLKSPLLSAADPDSLAYATAAGLALEMEGQGIGRINVVPIARTERKAAARRQVQVAVVGLVIVCIAVLAGIYFSNAMAASRLEQKNAVRENDRLTQAQKRLDKSKTEHDQVAKTYKTLTAGLGRNIAAVDAVKAVSDAIPKNSGIYLSQLTFDRAGKVMIQGTAKTESAATDLVLALQSSGLFTDVSLNSEVDAQAQAGAAPTAVPTAAAAPASAAAATAGKPTAKPETNMTFQITCRLPVPVIEKDKKAGATLARTTTTPATGGDVQ